MNCDPGGVSFSDTLVYILTLEISGEPPSLCKMWIWMDMASDSDPQTFHLSHLIRFAPGQLFGLRKAMH